MRRKVTLANITAGLVGALVLSYIVFMGYVMMIAQRPYEGPLRYSAAMGCFSFGHCRVAGIRPH